jgi:uncharacterized protein (DUF488 family)
VDGRGAHPGRPPFFTIGHSDRTLDEFLDLLESTRIELVVDVRKLPGSRRYPQFDGGVLADALGTAGIGYRHHPALGGRRPVSPDVAPDVNGLWTNRSFHNFADYALSDEFRDGLSRLREWGGERRSAVMCSEAVWWRCHRRIIADHLLAHGEDVVHVIGAGRPQPASLTPGALVGDDGSVVYPANPPRSG